MGFYLAAHLKKPTHRRVVFTLAPRHSLIVAGSPPFLTAPALHLLLHPPLSLGMKATLQLLLRPPLALGMKATETALRLGLSATAGQSQARRLLLPPLASRLAPSPPSSPHRPATLRTHLPLPSRLRWTVDGAWPLRLRCAPLAGSASQQRLLHQRRSRRFGSAAP